MTTPLLFSLSTDSRQFLVAFSGGLDSTVLLHQLRLWREHQPVVQLRAIHVHHGLSPHADQWAVHCQKLCECWQIPLAIVRVTLIDEGKGIEAQARTARYQAFRDALLPSEVLLTAHHLDDQCETVLLALKRGSGPAGLAAMPQSLPFGDTQLIRPLLNHSRAALEQWACNYHLSWIDDDSNADTRFDRNFLRQDILPLLRARWPYFADAAARSAALCGEQEYLLDELLAESLSSVTTAEGALTIAPLTDYSDARRRALLRRWLAQRGAAMPSRGMLDRLWQEVALAREDAVPCLRFGDDEVRRYQGELWRVKRTAHPRDARIIWPAPFETIYLPEGLGSLSLVTDGALRVPSVDEEVSVRFQAPCLIHSVGRNGGRKLKKIWQELGVPPWQRDATPLLFYGDTLIAAADRFVTQAGMKEEGQAGVRLVWQR